MDLSLVKLFLPAVLTFTLGIFITPLFSDVFYRYKMWKKKPRRENPIGHPNHEMSEAFKGVNNGDAELRTPRVGGIVIWASVVLTTVILFLLAYLFPGPVTNKLNLFSFNQTILPFVGLVAGALLGLVDDLLTIYVKDGVFINGFPRRYMITLVSLFGLVFGLWFFGKLGMASVTVPLVHTVINLGIWFIPFFIFVFLATFSSGVIDGIDGLAGGVLAMIFTALAVISYFQNQIDIAAFSLVISGGILAFLWFNIPPARFWMGETGMLGLMFALSIIVFLTDTVLILPIIGFPLVLTSASSLIQIVGKKIRGPKGKVFRVAPLHHHFESMGWSREKITMRYWIISTMFAAVGVIVALL